MGNSTIKLQDVNDWARAKGIPVPTDQPSGYGVSLAVKYGNDVMGQIIAERFNWKWNRKTANAFPTNSLQQDYPQVGLVDVGWLEDADRMDINNTSIPKPIRQMTVRKQLSRSSFAFLPVTEICWMYNSELSLGTWPGAGVTYNPLVTPVVKQNPIMSMLDANGNILIVTTFGTTGGSAPAAAANAAEGTTVTDGSVVWTVASTTSCGFRVNTLPGATGPVWLMTPYYQAKLFKLVDLASFINPLPDDFSMYFQTGYESFCLKNSKDPSDQVKGERMYQEWLRAMMDIRKQGNREMDAYGLVPACSPVDTTYGWNGLRNPQDPSQPY